MLTDTKLRTLKPREKVYRVADTNGLCIEVRPTGAKLWRYRYRHAGKPSMAALGEYPTMSLAEARAERDKARALVKSGASPTHVAKVERASRLEKVGNTFASVALEFLAKREKEGKDANGRAYNRTTHLPARRKMMQSWANYLESLRIGAKVIPLAQHPANAHQ